MTALGSAARLFEVVLCGAAVLTIVNGRRRRAASALVPPTARRSVEVEDESDGAESTRRPLSRVVEDAGIVLRRTLADLRAALDAQEIVFWGLNDAGDAFEVVASDPIDIAPAADPERLGQLLSWVAEERMPHVGGPETGLALASAHEGDVLLGVLSARRADGFVDDRERVRHSLPRDARQVGELAALLETRDEYARMNDQRDALVDAAHVFQQDRSVDALGTSICEFALRMTRARNAALVRWDPDRASGSVHSVSGGDVRLAGLALSAGSLVSEACVNALPAVWADASRLERGVTVFGAGEPKEPVGSLAVIPLRSARGVSGAIVIVGAARYDVRLADVRNLQLLAAMSAVSLETLWELDEFTHRARTDQLTGLPNRRAFDEAMTPALVLADRYELPLSLILADIDRFKGVNDRYGHEGGDAVLRSVARTLQGIIRTSDLCARFGGEEIAILLPNTAQKGAEDLAERLRAAVARQPVRVNGQDINVTVSFGVAALRESTTDRLGLFAAADAALYEAKAGGRNCVRSAAATVK